MFLRTQEIALTSRVRIACDGQSHLVLPGMLFHKTDTPTCCLRALSIEVEFPTDNGITNWHEQDLVHPLFWFVTMLSRFVSTRTFRQSLLYPTTTGRSLVRRLASNNVVPAVASTQTDKENASWNAMTLLGASAFALVAMQRDQKPDCCGIAGVVGSDSHDAR